MPFLFHFLQGLAVRSRARNPALMMPWLALGPSLWVAIGNPPAFFRAFAAAVRPSGLFGSLLLLELAVCLDTLTVRTMPTYGLGLFLTFVLAVSLSSPSVPALTSFLMPVLGAEGPSDLAAFGVDACVGSSSSAGVMSGSALTAVDVEGSSGVMTLEVESGDALTWPAFLTCFS